MRAAPPWEVPLRLPSLAKESACRVAARTDARTSVEGNTVGWTTVAFLFLLLPRLREEMPLFPVFDGSRCQQELALP